MEADLGAGNPLNEDKPVFVMVILAILFDLLSATCIAIATATTYWFTTQTGARVGLRTMVAPTQPGLSVGQIVHDWDCGQSCHKEVDCDGDWANAGSSMFWCSIAAGSLCLVGCVFQCLNLTPDHSRRKVRQQPTGAAGP